MAALRAIRRPGASEHRAEWTFYVDVYNTTDTRNPLLVSYTPNFERTVPTVYVPILPLLGLEVAY